MAVSGKPVLVSEAERAAVIAAVKQRGYTAAQLAEYLGVSKSCAACYLTGSVMPVRVHEALTRLVKRRRP